MRLRACLFLLLTLSVIAAPAHAQGIPGIEPTMAQGFGDPANSYSWSMAWFKGKLYVGTARNQLCVEGATADFYSPGYYKVPPEGFPEVNCPKDRYDMDLRADIWQFDPVPGKWTRVYRSPADIPNPRAAGKFVARDIGFRNMTVHRDANGTQALYVAGVTTDEYIPELAAKHPPRILRTTDGKTFKPLAASPGVLDTPFGKQRAMGYRAMASYKGRLFVTAGGGLTGDGVILEVKAPGSSRPSFEQVSPNTMAVFELATFNGALYAGVGDGVNGYSVWRTRAGSPARFEPVVTEGAGRGKAITSVVSMQVFNDRLYVGSSGWAVVFPSSELIRINRDDSFDVVVGNPRTTRDAGVKFPISGLPDGFGNVFNAHFWRQATVGDALYLGTNDWSWAFRSWPILDWLLGPEFGFDLYGTCDGQFWWPATRNAFGAGLYNFGARTLAPTPIGGFVGSANHVKGTGLWHATVASPCRPNQRAGQGVARTRRGRATAAPARPQRLLTEQRRCGTVLTWDRAAGASKYRVLRSRYLANEVRIARSPSRPGAVPEVPTVPVRPVRSGGTRVNLSVAGPATGVGTTSRPLFVDRGARRGVTYRYQVVGVGRSGRKSDASNTAIVPSARPAVTFSAAAAAVSKLHGAARSAGLRRLELARRGWERTGAAAAAAQLDGVRGLDTGTGPGAASAADDAEDAMFRLERHLQASEAC